MPQRVFSPSITAVLDSLQIDSSHFLSKGGEGYIFSYGADTVVKIYEKVSKEYLVQLTQLQKILLRAHLPFHTPEILDIGKVNDTQYTIEKRLTGKQLEVVLFQLDAANQNELLEKYFKAMNSFNAIELPTYLYGQILKDDQAITSEVWSEFLIKKLLQRAERSHLWLRNDVRDYEHKVSLLQEVIAKEVTHDQKNLVHGDYYFNNVLVGDDLEISAVLDFSMHSIVGDRKLDAASICFLTLNNNTTEEHLHCARHCILDQYGSEIEKYLDIYALYYAIYYADTYEFDKNSYKWCLGILNNSQIWRRLGFVR